MLNEKLEYEQYQFDYYKKNKKKYRICLENFSNKFTGIPRALEIIARYELFEKQSTPDKTRKKLLEWLDELSKKENLKMILGSAKSDNLEQLISDKQKQLDDFLKHYRKSTIDLKNTGMRLIANINDINVSTWDKTVASALEKGPLKEYILVEKKDLCGKVYKFNRGTERSLSDNRAREHKDYLLKLTAHYLIENKLQQKSVTLKELLIYNWSAYTRGSSFYFKADESGEIIVTEAEPAEKIDVYKKTRVAGSLNKFSFDPKWIDNFELVDISEKGSLEKWMKAPENKGKSYYIDQGAFMVLKKRAG